MLEAHFFLFLLSFLRAHCHAPGHCALTMRSLGLRHWQPLCDYALRPLARRRTEFCGLSPHREAHPALPALFFLMQPFLSTHSEAMLGFKASSPAS